MSSKGGVGKTVIAGTLALLLAKDNIETGLLDLDFTNPGLHILLGADIRSWPEEEKGVVPPKIYGVRFMTAAYYSGDEPL
ncbi:MAG: ATP-binding protein, partial [Crenarchaeota archaeon]|nr:ATP-binding protein [Thermoproteota archaeon]